MGEIVVVEVVVVEVVVVSKDDVFKKVIVVSPNVSCIFMCFLNEDGWV